MTKNWEWFVSVRINDCPKTASGEAGWTENGSGARFWGSRTAEMERERVSRVKGPEWGAEREKRAEETMVEEGKSK